MKEGVQSTNVCRCIKNMKANTLETGTNIIGMNEWVNHCRHFLTKIELTINLYGSEMGVVQLQPPQLDHINTKEVKKRLKTTKCGRSPDLILAELLFS